MCSDGSRTAPSEPIEVNYVGAGSAGSAPPDSVLFSVRYGGLSSTSFNAVDQGLACTNILAVQPGGTCRILTVLPGSAIVTGTVTYSSTADASSLVQQLVAGTASATLQQGVWNSGVTTGVTTLVANAEPAPAQPRKPDPPTGVTLAKFDGNCPSAPAMDVTFTPPADKTGILAYTATCYPNTSGQGVTATVVATGAGTSSIRVTPLTAVVSYKCDVQSVTVDDYSTILTSSSAQSTGCAVPPGTPIVAGAVPTPSATSSSATITWAAGTDSVPSAGDPAFFATCVASGTSCPTSPTPSFNINRPAGCGTTTNVGSLSASTAYDCYVIAKNPLGAGVCSAPQTVTTQAAPVAPGPATMTSAAPTVGSTSSSVTIVWTPGTASVPAATDPSFFATCVTSGTACPTSPTFDINDPGAQTSTTVSGLSSGTTYDCYVVAKNPSGAGVCSAPQTATTTGTAAPTIPCTNPTASTTTDWVLGCGRTSCDDTCPTQSKACTVAGMRAIDTRAKGDYVLSLFGLPVTSYDDTAFYTDTPSLDIGSTTSSVFFWSGVQSTCNAQAQLAISRRLCCCGANCPVV